MVNVASQSDFDGKVVDFCNYLAQQFYIRTVVQGKKSGVDYGDLKLDIKKVNRTLWLTFSKGTESHSVVVPIPYVENGVELIMQNEVKRALCKYFLKRENTIVDYISILHKIFCGESVGIIPENLASSSILLKRVINSFRYGNASTMIYVMQRTINEVVNVMPLHETYLGSWIMNHRLVIIDEKFDIIKSPAEQLEYQVKKNREHFHKGWTSIGLSDGVLATKNYILTTDVRKLTPFGLKYHNPGRNLYSTYGMKGVEEPLVRSRSMQNLMDAGITRKGWNFFTLFVDIPDVFEDQIMVDKSHLNKFVQYERRYQCFGELLIKKGNRLKKGQEISIAPDGKVKTFNLACESAKVERITETVTNIGGNPEKVYNVTITFIRKFKDGTKFTNMHGNKGVVRFKKLGYAVDPRTGESRKIDVIASANSIKKRRNYGQILEALCNNVNGEKVVIVEDDFNCSVKQIEDRLRKEGFPKDGTWVCHTYAGKLTGICGKIFWGVIAQPEGSLWEKNTTTRKNGVELRTAGLKFSTVEFRALDTRFGKDNPITDEILSYAQGAENLHEEFKILNSKRGRLPIGVPVINAVDVKAVNQSSGTIMDRKDIAGTVVDETFYPGGFILRLPTLYQTILDSDWEVVSEGAPVEWSDYEKTFMKGFHTINSIYIPDSNLRKCWRHEAGKYGLSDIGALVNNMIVACHRLIMRPQDKFNFTLFYRRIQAYFDRVASKMSTKRGNISQYGMAVRYPYSAKAYATLTNRLPKNTIEIHRDMARDIHVKNGDIVLVERFPCLGFMSIRPQKVHITNDPLCKYVIRVSGNSLGSLSLDFDGDTLFIASFHTPEATMLLRKEFRNPNKSCYDVIKKLNKKAGTPHVKEMCLQEYEMYPFADLDCETHAELVRRATGVKSHTGPVIALAYNIMRIVENSEIKNSQKMNVAVEVFLDKVGNSVFKQKHGVKSLHDIVIDAICMADVETLVEHGFNRGTSTVICDIIKKKALERGVEDLRAYHECALSMGASNIINRIVREDNMTYFASRANLEACKLLHHIEQKAVDIPSRTLDRIMSGKANTIVTPLEKHETEKALLRLNSKKMKEACSELNELIDRVLIKRITPVAPGSIESNIRKSRKKERQNQTRS